MKAFTAAVAATTVVAVEGGLRSRGLWVSGCCYMTDNCNDSLNLWH